MCPKHQHEIYIEAKSGPTLTGVHNSVHKVNWPSSLTDISPHLRPQFTPTLAEMEICPSARDYAETVADLARYYDDAEAEIIRIHSQAVKHHDQVRALRIDDVKDMCVDFSFPSHSKAVDSPRKPAKILPRPPHHQLLLHPQSENPT